MKVLTCEEIERMGDKLISPFENTCLTPIGYDLRVGNRVILLSKSEEIMIASVKSTIIPPRERFAVETLETISLTDDMFANLFTRISLSWKGLTNLGTKVDPMFKDKLVLVFSNDSDHPFELRFKDSICNIMFFRYDNPAPNLKPRGRPSFLTIPSFPAPIREPLDEGDIRQRFGFGVFSVMSYLKPKLHDYEKRLVALEGLRNTVVKILLGFLATIIGGILLWYLTEIVPKASVHPELVLGLLVFSACIIAIILIIPSDKSK